MRVCDACDAELDELERRERASGARTARTDSWEMSESWRISTSRRAQCNVKSATVPDGRADSREELPIGGTGDAIRGRRGPRDTV